MSCDPQWTQSDGLRAIMDPYPLSRTGLLDRRGTMWTQAPWLLRAMGNRCGPIPPVAELWWAHVAALGGPRWTHAPYRAPWIASMAVSPGSTVQLWTATHSCHVSLPPTPATSSLATANLPRLPTPHPSSPSNGAILVPLLYRLVILSLDRLIFSPVPLRSR